MHYKKYPLTLANWESEYKRLACCLEKVANPSTHEAKAYQEQMQAVKSIIQEVQDGIITPYLVVIE